MKNLTVLLILTLALINFGYAQTRTIQPATLIKQGEAFLEEYEFEKAVAAADQALQKIQSARRKSPANLAAVYFLYGKIYEEGLYLDKAIEAYTKAIKFDSKQALVYSRRGNVYKYTGEFEKADADFAKAQQRVSGRYTTIIGDSDSIGVGRGSLREIPEVFQIIHFKEVWGYPQFVTVIDLNTDGEISGEETRSAYISRLFKLNKLVRFNPKSDLALWKRGDLFLQMNELSNQLFLVSAETDFLNAYDLNPRFEYLNNVGAVRAKRDNQTNYEFAVKRFTDAIQINDQSTEVFYNRGLAYLKLNETEKAAADFTEAINLNPQSALAYKSRAKAFRAIGKTSEADADENTLTKLGYK
jgi:tetratricopeptide (TPR) repeat protein